MNLQVILVPDYLHKVEEESSTLYQTLPLPLGRPSLNPRPDRPEAAIIGHSNDYCSGAGSEDSDSLRNLNYTVDCVCV